MPSIDAKTIFAILGPLFLILGAARCLQAGSFPSQARTWLLIGAIFCAVAAWLWWGAPATPLRTTTAQHRPHFALGMTFVDCPKAQVPG